MNSKRLNFHDDKFFAVINLEEDVILFLRQEGISEYKTITLHKIKALCVYDFLFVNIVDGVDVTDVNSENIEYIIKELKLSSREKYFEVSDFERKTYIELGVKYVSIISSYGAILNAICERVSTGSAANVAFAM